jgi:NAD(P)-dependent dehydrogenase (short-subunit alcohol dehydrogenase family)
MLSSAAPSVLIRVGQALLWIALAPDGLNWVSFLSPERNVREIQKGEKNTVTDLLKGKVAIVTGAGSVPGAQDRPPIGNGRAAAIVYAREGAKVVAVDIDMGSAEETKELILKEGGTCSVFRGDVSLRQDCRSMAEQCLKTYDRIDILHNNVGIIQRKPAGILEADEEDWDRVMNVNVKSIFNTCRAVVPTMIKQREGCIVNISSVAGVKHNAPGFFIYSVSKAAVNKLTQCLAFELADKGIRVNCILPGMMDTPTIYKELTKLYGGDIERMRKDRNDRIPVRSMGDAWDIAYASLFLVSRQAKYITGQILGVDGGAALT